MALAAHLILGTRWTFVGGKGGVGKTTIAAALAVELADRGEAVTLLSTDPAHSLGDALGLPLDADPGPHPELESLRAFELSASRERADFLARSGDAITTLIERGTYLDTDDADALTDLALPGMDELAALLRLSRLADEDAGNVVVDTAPTGHTLRLLDLPAAGLAWLESLEAMQAKHDAVAAAFSGGRIQPDDASRFVADLRRDLERLAASFVSPTETRFVLVTNPDAVVAAETLRYREELERRGVALAGTVLNRGRCADSRPIVGVAAPGPTPSSLDFSVCVPALGTIGRDLASLRRVAASASGKGVPTHGVSPDGDAPASPGGDEHSVIIVGGRYVVPADRRLYLVGGKGGVGKSTIAGGVAAGLAHSRADRGRILLLSVDPAGSLTEILGRTVGSAPMAVDGSAHLFARQIDAEQSWSDFTTHYREEVGRLFEGLSGGGLSASLDKQVLDRLMDLVPPGVDELVSIMEVIDLIEDGEYDALVVDTAPTGHFLRLLELPGVALDWCHAILRLLLKYRSVVSLEGAGERILKLSRSLKALRARLIDPAFTWACAVALPESLSIPESERLIDGLRMVGIEPAALIVNRALTDGGKVDHVHDQAVSELLRIDPTLPAVATSQMRPSPRGLGALEEFYVTWRNVRLADAG